MNKISNNVQLIGYLGQDPEMITFDGGKKKTSVSIATQEYYKKAKGEKVKETQWHNLVAWDKLAEYMATSLKKGSEVVLSGKLTSRSYLNKEGQKRFVTEILVTEMKQINKTEAEN
jgi:single-strand DNA-binding protein